MTKQKGIKELPKNIDEVMPVHFPYGLPEITLDYFDADFLPSKKMFDKSYKFKLFDRSLETLLNAEATVLGNMILQGGNEEIQEVLKIVKEKPILLHYKVIATDPLGTKVHGTLLQIAAMAGDVNLKLEIFHKNDFGLVEKLIAVGELQPDTVVEQLKCVMSKEAIRENEARIQRYLDPIYKFGKKEINAEQLDCALRLERSKAVISGYVFDPKILEIAAEWFRCKIHLLGGWRSEWVPEFWVIAIGKLQSKVSSRDAQLLLDGIAHMTGGGGEMPDRTLTKYEGGDDFYNTSSKLGHEHWIDVYGICSGSIMGYAHLESAAQRLVETKIQVLANACKPVLERSNRL